jgi:Mg2+ and Co2+ transporter CorA
MHHSPEWFHWKSKKAIDSVLRKHTDIIFQGHEHDIRGIQTEDFLISKGGEFSGEFTHESSFSILVFNTEDSELQEYEYVWDVDNTIFHRKRNGKYTLRQKNHDFSPTPSFLKAFFEDDQKLSSNILDYFVFPKLYRTKTRRNEVINLITEDTIWEKLEERKIINITGKSGYGKTFLLKYLYEKSLKKNLIPLFLERGSFRKSNADKLIKNLFSDQYGDDDILFESYAQTDNSRKILFIDDLDLINLKSKLIEEMGTKVGFIVYSSQNVLELDVDAAAREEIFESERHYDLRIEEFYKEKRSELVEKIYSIKPNDDPSILPYLKGILDHLAERRHGLFELSPENIVQYIKFFMGNSAADDRKGEAVFNVVFETNLRNALIAQCGEKSIDYCLLVLEEISSLIHHRKNERIDYSSIVRLVEELNENRGLYIDTQKMLDSILKSNVLAKTDVNNVYVFANRNYLAYFIAKKLNRLIEKNGLGIPELQYVFTNICFGINDNILLFLSFLRDNTGFALSLCDLLDSLVKDEPELNFDISNVRFIKRQRDTKSEMPSSQEKKEIEQRSDDAERYDRQNESDLIQYKSVYDYNEEDVNKHQYRIVRAIKYLEVISKSLISHFVNLELPEKRRIVDLMYTAPNKILYALFKPFDDRYDEIINEIKRLVDDINDEDIQLTKSEIEEIFNDSAAAICLSLYDNISFYGTNSETLRLLNEYSMVISNHRIENLIMEEIGGGSVSFVDKAIKLMEKEDDRFIMNLIRRIVRKHIITKNIDYSIRDRIADKIFPNTPKKHLLLTSISQRGKNE